MLTTTTFRKRGKTTLKTIARWSYVAKGILFASLGAVLLGTVGFSLIQAAWYENPVLVKNMDDVFLAIRFLPFGNVLLHLEALGLLLPGGFMLTMAWYFPFRTA